MNIYLRRRVQIDKRERERKKNKLYPRRLFADTTRAKEKEKKGTLTTAVYSDHIARSFYSIFFIDQPMHNSLALAANNTSTVVRARSMMNKEEERRRTNERSNLYARDREKSFFFFSLLHRC